MNPDQQGYRKRRSKAQKSVFAAAHLDSDRVAELYSINLEECVRIDQQVSEGVGDKDANEIEAEAGSDMDSGEEDL